MDVSPLKYVWHHCDISLSRSSESPNLRAGSKCIIYQPWSMGWRCKVRSQCSCSSSPNPTFLIYKCVGPPPPLRWRWQRIIHHSSRLLMKISSLNSPCFAKKLWRREGFCIDVVLVAHVTTTIICYSSSCYCLLAGRLLLLLTNERKRQQV